MVCQSTNWYRVCGVLHLFGDEVCTDLHVLILQAFLQEAWPLYRVLLSGTHAFGSMSTVPSLEERLSLSVLHAMKLLRRRTVMKRLFILAAIGLLCAASIFTKTRWVRGKHDGERITVFPINEWHQIHQIGRCNWYAFTLIYVYGEINSMANLYELTITLLGFGFYAHYDYDFANSRVKHMADEAYESFMREKDENTQNNEECE